MRGLTLWQPWASLLATGAKRWETRRWSTSYRGPVLIHAAARRPPRSSYSASPDAEPVGIRPTVVEAMIEALGVAEFDDLPRGAVIAMADLAVVELVDGDDRMHELIARAHGLSMAAARHEWLFGDWTPGRYAWGFENLRRIQPPIEAAGAQRLWNPPSELVAAVARQATA